MTLPGWDIADARSVAPVDFFNAVTGKPPMSQAEKAEREARYARVNLIITIERAEFARARRERKAIIREGQGDESYEAFRERLNAPFTHARERVNARLAEFDARRAA